MNNCLLGSVKLSKTADLDKYKYSSYDIGFDSCAESSLTNGRVGKSVFGANMNSSMHIDNKNKDILILREAPTQGLDGTVLTNSIALNLYIFVALTNKKLLLPL